MQEPHRLFILVRQVMSVRHVAKSLRQNTVRHVTSAYMADKNHTSVQPAERHSLIWGIWRSTSGVMYRCQSDQGAPTVERSFLPNVVCCGMATVVFRIVGAHCAGPSIECVPWQTIHYHIHKIRLIQQLRLPKCWPQTIQHNLNQVPRFLEWEIATTLRRLGKESELLIFRQCLITIPTRLTCVKVRNQRGTDSESTSVRNAASCCKVGATLCAISASIRANVLTPALTAEGLLWTRVTWRNILGSTFPRKIDPLCWLIPLIWLHFRWIIPLNQPKCSRLVLVRIWLAPS